jgi:hypothetical protein
MDIQLAEGHAQQRDGGQCALQCALYVLRANDRWCGDWWRMYSESYKTVDTNSIWIWALYQIDSILVSHIHTHLLLVAGIKNHWYIKLCLMFSSKRCGICSTCIGTLVVWILYHSQCQWILTTSRVDCQHYG